MSDTLPVARRRILIVSYWFPPEVGAAAERIAGLAQYLPAHGWDVHVLTAVRTGGVGAAVAEAEADRNTAFDVSAPGVTLHAVEDPRGSDRPFGDFDPRVKPPKWKRLARELIFPDRFGRWARRAAATGAELARSISFDVVFATFPPASTVWAALRIESPAKFVLDYRDRWFGPGGYEPRFELARRRHERLERLAVARADRIVAVSEPMADAIAQEQGIPRAKVIVIPNGYEVSSRDGATRGGAAAPEPMRRDPDDRLVIAHVGTVIARNRPELFLAALKRVADDPRLSNILFRFVGNLSHDYVASLGLNRLVETTGLLPRNGALREMQAADALLLLTGAYVGHWGASAKLFEYLQSGLPVLCLEEEPGSNDRAILERFVPDRAFFAPISDADRIAEQITRIRAYRAGRPAPAMELDASFREFSRAALTARLAESLEAALEG
ncbi:MAG: glycosyltransferase [Phycisphaerae bacterium]|nr:glycosyltransferase [Phycisphaerae bacterium]